MVGMVKGFFSPHAVANIFLHVSPLRTNTHKLDKSDQNTQSRNTDKQ